MVGQSWNKEKRDEIFKLYDRGLKELPHNKEDSNLIYKLTETYCRKRIDISNSKAKITAAALLWIYSKINFLSEGNKKWSKQSIADIFEASPKTIGDKASEIMRAMKIDYWDQRFARESIANESPYKKYVMTPGGFIMSKESLPEGVYLPSLKKSKEDYVHEGWDLIEEDDTEQALSRFKKALEIDGNYIDAYNGLGVISLLNDDYEKSKEHQKKAYLLTKEKFKEYWPSKLDWSILENQQYLRAISGFAHCCWRDNNFQEAERLFRLILRLNPTDDLFIRFSLAAALDGMPFDKYTGLLNKAIEEEDYIEIEKLLEKQNNIHNFWKGDTKE